MKAKHFIMSSLVLLFVQVIVSCTYTKNALEIDGPKVTQVRPHRSFEQIEIMGSPTVCYTQADSFSVHVEGPENLVNEILTKVEDHTLVIRNRGKIGIINISVGDMSQVTVYVTSPDLVGICLNGSGDFMCRQQIDTDQMSVELRGSGDIDIHDLICDQCVTTLVGSGDVNIRRLEAQTHEVGLTGSGDVKVEEHRVGVTDITLRGSGDIAIDFAEGCKEASCQLMGSGDITLSGNLHRFSQHKTGSGDIDTGSLIVK